MVMFWDEKYYHKDEICIDDEMFAKKVNVIVKNVQVTSLECGSPACITPAV